MEWLAQLQWALKPFLQEILFQWDCIYTLQISAPIKQHV